MSSTPARPTSQSRTHWNATNSSPRKTRRRLVSWTRSSTGDPKIRRQQRPPKIVNECEIGAFGDLSLWAVSARKSGEKFRFRALLAALQYRNAWLISIKSTRANAENHGIVTVLRV